MKNKLVMFVTILSIVFAVSFSVMGAQAQTESEEEHSESDESTYVVRDSATVLLGFKTIPPNDFIHLLTQHRTT